MISKTFSAKTESLPLAIEFVEDELGKIGCSMKSVMQISICVEEMFVNVAHYAYEGDDGEVTLNIDKESGLVSITLIASGIPFDPLAKDDPDITLSSEDRQIGGLGIFMVKKSMNEVHYERRGEKNIFTMKKEI